MKSLARRVWLWALPGLLAVDMLANGIWGCGDFRQTISACWGQTYTVSAVARVGCAALDLIDPGHCADAVVSK
ncbi:MAG: hypothetical protein ACRDHF_13160 [Tepidiformaceae bacterium]